MAAEGNENRVIIDTSPVKRQLGYGQRPGPSFRCVAVQSATIPCIGRRQSLGR